jgi:hypothetical protein
LLRSAVYSGHFLNHEDAKKPIKICFASLRAFAVNRFTAYYYSLPLIPFSPLYD